MTLIRPDLDTLPAYVPGRSVPGLIKLASNEVAEPPAAPVLEAIARAAAGGNRYPDLGVVELTARIAEFHDVAPERVAVGCGSVTLCQQLVQISCLGPGDEVMFAWRSFEAYPIVTQIGGADVRTVPLDGEFRHDLDAMAAAVTDRTRLIFVCSPNNPTGPAVHRAEFERFLETVGPDVVVALDEAYAEFVTDPEAVTGRPLLDAHPNLVVLRTFSKAYRLAGLRVGYALTSPDVATALRKVCPPFSVSSVAQAGAIAALENRDAILADLRPILAERDRVRTALVGDGFTVPESQSNFLWLPLGDRSAEFAAHCADQKVVVRPFQPDGVRVTVSSPEENDTLLAAASSYQPSSR
ncbi:histidinol-phosphate transaminase [Pseudonocardia endophytica]|uniref:Aromatic amino acid aminotransferase n=1 Tax=Pseudonocardia endophytica TaxID=401976 RepID=A0A4R1I228_PSEEN|nr:histidinol-phosphate transaminase [Pseudonocardia endophytica]TCK27320.1 histidinol-phosphate aminotransferase [Pseudonocardia endophytica]